MILVVLSLLFLSALETWLWMRAWILHPTRPPQEASWKSAVVYCTGVSFYATPQLRPEQARLLKAVQERLELEKSLPDILPLTTLRVHLPQNLVTASLRNFWQAFIAIHRPQWVGLGLAKHMAYRLGKPPTGATLVVLCQSAGASLALAAVSSLARLLNTRIVVISFGGVFADSSGFDRVDRFFHFQGDRDWWSRTAALCLPSRRSKLGALARAKQEGRFLELSSGSHTHYGPNGYMGQEVEQAARAMSGPRVREAL